MHSTDNAAGRLAKCTDERVGRLRVCRAHAHAIGSIFSSRGLDDAGSTAIPSSPCYLHPLLSAFGELLPQCALS
jgi:hypothetical protein